MWEPIAIHPIFRVTELYTLYYFEHKSGYRFAGESHDFWEIIYVDKGSASGINGSEPYRLQQGQMIFHHPNVFHNFRAGDFQKDISEDCDIIVVSFNGDLDELEKFRDGIFTLTVYERQIFNHLLEEAKGMFGKSDGKNFVYNKEDPQAPELVPGGKQMVANLLEQLLLSLYRKQIHNPSEVQPLPLNSLGYEYQITRQVIAYLHENIYRNINFSDVVTHFNISETQLKKMFREVTGYSVMQYYRKCVVSKIEYHIQQQSLNFTELSDLFNFSSIHYFSKFYKRETGHTLRDCLKNSKKK